MTERDIQIILMLSNLCTGLGTIILGVTAIWGLRQWREQLQFQAKAEIAKKMGIQALRVKQQFNIVRHPITWKAEHTIRSKNDDAIPEDRVFTDEGYARLERVKQLAPLIDELQEISWEAQLIFGTEFDEEIKVYLDNYNKLFKAIRTRYDSSQIRSIESENRTELREKLEDIIYGSSKDELSLAIDSATASIKEKARKYLGSAEP
ncbi:MAG TPA: hypothetical protein PLQ56_14530 [Aggregatilineales bacterium]|nr:hypothetical protein [Aggregatilineales bacterium]